MFSELSRPVGAAIVNENVVPILIGLTQNAFDALGEEVPGVVKRSYDAN